MEKVNTREGWPRGHSSYKLVKRTRGSLDMSTNLV